MTKNYNAELQDLLNKTDALIKEATLNGWSFSNDELILDEKIPVVEVYSRYETTYEEYGRFYIVKTTVPIKLEDYEQIMSLDIKDTDAVLDCIWDLIRKYKKLKSFNGFEYDCDNCVIAKHTYGNDSSQKVFEMRFNVEPMSCYAEGYINVFKMPKEDLTKQDDIDICLHKYMHDN